MHVSTLGHESGVLDVARNLDLIHAIDCARGTNDVFLHHDTAHVVGTEGKTQLPDLAALRDPRRLEIGNVVEDHPGERQRAQIVDTGRLDAAELGVWRLIAPGDKRREAAGLILEIAELHQVFDTLLETFDGPIHHGSGGAQTKRVRDSHDLQPLR